MMDCPKEILTEIQTDIDAFILKTNSNWISKDRLHLPPEQGGLGAIKLETYAKSLRSSWYKILKNGLWNDILMAKVNHQENICFIKEKQIHPMHIAIRPIARAFETLQACFLKTKDDLITLKKPLETFKAAIIGRTMKFVTEENCPYLYKKGGISEFSAFDLTNQESIATIPRCKSNEELTKLLCIENLPFWEKITALSKTKQYGGKLLKICLLRAI